MTYWYSVLYEGMDDDDEGDELSFDSWVHVVLTWAEADGLSETSDDDDDEAEHSEIEDDEIADKDEMVRAQRSNEKGGEEWEFANPEVPTSQSLESSSETTKSSGDGSTPTSTLSTNSSPPGSPSASYKYTADETSRVVLVRQDGQVFHVPGFAVTAQTWGIGERATAGTSNSPAIANRIPGASTAEPQQTVSVEKSISQSQPPSSEQISFKMVRQDIKDCLELVDEILGMTIPWGEGRVHVPGCAAYRRFSSRTSPCPAWN